MNAYYPETCLIQAHNCLDLSRPKERLLQNPKTGGFRELFLPENNFKICSKVNSRKWLNNRNLWFLEHYF